MSDLIERLRTAARNACERHNRVDQFDPAWERKPKDFIEWEAADEIEQLRNALRDISDGNQIDCGDCRHNEKVAVKALGNLWLTLG
jgi:hypothetical protein